MACGVEQDRLSALLPDGFTSLHPVMRISAEIRSGSGGCLEPNTPVEFEGNKGWVIIAFGERIPFARSGKTVVFKPDFFEICFTGVGIEDSRPAEKDNIGRYFPGSPVALRKAEIIKSRKNFCGCSLRRSFHDGMSLGNPLRSSAGRLRCPLRAIDFSFKTKKEHPLQKGCSFYLFTLTFRGS